MSHSWPEPSTSNSIYQRLLAGNDPVAQSDFADAFLDPLLNFLRHVFPFADDHNRLTAAEDAVLSVIHDPAIYDPDQGTLVGFLQMAAKRDLANLHAKDARHHNRREHRDCVELPANGGNHSTEGLADNLPSLDDPKLASVIAAFDERERQVFDLMRAGERRTAEFAAVLGLLDRPVEEQAREVKRVKDRIIKRLQRTWG